MTMKPATTVATAFLAFVALAQLTRYLLRVAVTANGIVVPLWASLVAFVFTGALAVLLWREGHR